MAHEAMDYRAIRVNRKQAAEKLFFYPAVSGQVGNATHFFYCIKLMVGSDKPPADVDSKGNYESGTVTNRGRPGQGQEHR